MREMETQAGLTGLPVLLSALHPVLLPALSGNLQLASQILTDTKCDHRVL